MVLAAAFKLLLARYSGQQDICIGTPVAGRQRPELEPLIGCFVNTLVLRSSVDPAQSFEAFLQQVKATALEAYAHQDLPFEQLVDELKLERHTSHTPLFQAMLVLQNMPLGSMELPGLTLQALPTDSGSAKFDLTLTFVEEGGRLHGELEYDTDLFDAGTVERMAAHFKCLVDGVLADPGAALGALPLLGQAERQQLLHGWNATAADYPRHETLQGLFEAQAARTPRQPALVYEGRTLDYGELNARANRLARHLRTLGVGPDVLVGVCAERSLEMVVGLLAVLKAGGAYVPLDPAYPRERLAYMLADARPAVLLTQSHLLSLLPEAGCETLCLDTQQSLLQQQAADDLPCRTLPQHLAYVIYTSGSTGRPKGVGIDHAGIVNRLHWMQQEYRLSEADRVLQKTPFSFDVSVWEFFWPLLTGATLVVARPGGHQDVQYLARLMADERVTTLHFVPPMLEVFLNAADVSGLQALRQVMCSGQALPLALQQRFFERLPQVQLHNLYGPTEASVDVTAWQCRPQPGQWCVPIGRPIANIQIHVLDGQQQPVPVGVAGELHIAGVGLARGYVNRPALTAEKFVPNPFGAPGSRMYRSGDLVRYLPGGEIEYLGRLDDQVKIRGLRIELGEIEAALKAQPGVRDALVMAREDVAGDQRLVAYVLGQGAPVDAAALRAALARTLPEYMVPPHVVNLPAFPLSPNGKVDRKALPAPDHAAPADAQKERPRTEVESLLASLWAEVLRVERVGLHDDFFQLGGHSLLAVQLVERIRREGLQVDARTLMAAPTVAGGGGGNGPPPPGDDRPPPRQTTRRPAAGGVHRPPAP